MRAAPAALLATIALGLGCHTGPTDIVYGQDECAACRMRITDQRFASELVTTHGKAYKFDAIECLVGFLDHQVVPTAEIHSLWVANSANPGELIDARTAYYLRTDRVRSPMGLNVLAFRNAADRDVARAQYEGEVVAWEQLPELSRLARANLPRTRPGIPQVPQR